MDSVDFLIIRPAARRDTQRMAAKVFERIGRSESRGVLKKE